MDFYKALVNSASGALDPLGGNDVAGVLVAKADREGVEQFRFYHREALPLERRYWTDLT